MSRAFQEKIIKLLIFYIDRTLILGYDIFEERNMTLGERLLMFINKANMSQKQLAEAIGVTPTRLNYRVKDKREPDVYHIKQLAKALGITGDDLLGTNEFVHEESSPSDILYISRPSGNVSTDELRKQLHDLIDQMEDEDLRLMSGLMVKFKRD